MILTLGEIKNGWNEVSLKKHIKEMERNAAQLIYGQRRPVRPRMQNNHYSPQKWRR